MPSVLIRYLYEEKVDQSYQTQLTLIQNIEHLLYRVMSPEKTKKFPVMMHFKVLKFQLFAFSPH